MTVGDAVAQITGSNSAKGMDIRVLRWFLVGSGICEVLIARLEQS